MKKQDKIRVNFQEFKVAEQNSWVLPAWGYPMSACIMPVFSLYKGKLTPVGTSFLISKFGLIATAAHVIQEALREATKVHQAIVNGSCEKELSVENVELFVLHQSILEDGKFRATIWPIVNVQIAYPTDVAFGCLKSPFSFPTMTFPLRPAAPRIGDTVFSMGYCESQYPDGGIPFQEVLAGKFDWHRDYSHRFMVMEGKTKALFIEKFATGYADGPCFMTDSDIKPGQSGGPVFNSEGSICGVNLGGSSLFIEHTSLASLIYPALAANLKFSTSIPSGFSFNLSQPLINFISEGCIITDGSEKLARISKIGAAFLVDPQIHSDDASSVFRNFHDYQNFQPAKPIVCDN